MKKFLVCGKDNSVIFSAVTKKSITDYLQHLESIENLSVKIQLYGEDVGNMTALCWLFLIPRDRKLYYKHRRD